MSVVRPVCWEIAIRWFPLIPNDYMFGPSVCIQAGDIATWSTTGPPHAIVCPNEPMLGGGPVYEAIHNAAGPELRNAYLAIPEVQPGVRCPVGEARITPGYKLREAYVIHVVFDPDTNVAESLRSTYISCFLLAKENNIKHVVFPAISFGTSSYTVEEAATIAFSTVKEFKNDIKQVHFFSIP